MIDSKWYEGGCFCGAVRFRVRGEAVWKGGCTCNSCVKSHGAPYVVWAGFDKSDFEILKGKLTSFVSQPNVKREFCSKCGSTLTYGKDGAGNQALEEAVKLVYVAVASLDEPQAYPPDEVVHGQEKIAWLQLGDEIPIREFISPTAGHLQFGGINQTQEKTDQ